MRGLGDYREALKQYNRAIDGAWIQLQAFRMRQEKTPKGALGASSPGRVFPEDQQGEKEAGDALSFEECEARKEEGKALAQLERRITSQMLFTKLESDWVEAMALGCLVVFLVRAIY